MDDNIKLQSKTMVLLLQNESKARNNSFYLKLLSSRFQSAIAIMVIYTA